MARLGYGHVTTNGVKIHYYRTGDEKPPVLFLHGFMDNGLCWSRLAFRLEPFYDVILVDSRGHGLSETTKNGYTPEDRAADIAGLINELQLPKPVIIGHSMGAETAIFTAAYHPQLVGSLILEDPPFWDSPDNDIEEARIRRSKRLRTRLLDLKSKSLPELKTIVQNENPGWDETDLFQWSKAKQQVNPAALGIIDEPRESWRYYARMVSCPALLITGEQEKGAIVSPAVAQELTKMWRKNVKIIKIAEVGHNVRREGFNIFLNEVKMYLRKQTNW